MDAVAFDERQVVRELRLDRDRVLDDLAECDGNAADITAMTEFGPAAVTGSICGTALRNIGAAEYR